MGIGQEWLAKIFYLLYQQKVCGSWDLARAWLPDILFLRHGSNRLCPLYDPKLPRADLHSLIQYASGHLNETHPTGNPPLVGFCVFGDDWLC
jgi:hypothetical protein